MDLDVRCFRGACQAHWLCALCVLIGPGLGCADGWRLRFEPLSPGELSQAPREDAVHGPAADDVSKGSSDPLASDGWAHQVVAGGSEIKPSRHWRHVGLESVDGKLLIEVSELHAALGENATQETLTAVIARLLLLRHGAPINPSQSDVDWLAELIAHRGFSGPLRAAAVETLAASQPTLARGAFQSMFGKYATLPTEVRVELLRRGAETNGPASDAAFVKALGDSAVEVRIAAVEAWATAAPLEAPPKLADLVNDLDPRVRAAAVRTLAEIGCAGALNAAQSGFRDSQLEVRLAAIEALGKIEQPSALELLHAAAHEEGDVIRAAAATALAAQGDVAAVLEAADDQDATVRAAAANALRGISSATARGLARRLIADRSMAVRRAAIESVADWPAHEATPLLLDALGDRALDTRQAAHAALSVIWPRAAEFRPAADTESRATQLAALRDHWLAEHSGAPAPPPPNTAPFTPSIAASALTDELLAAHVTALADARAGNDQAAIASLRLADAQLESRLLDWADRNGRVIPDTLVNEVLAARNPALRQLGDWDALSPAERRQLVSTLAQEMLKQPLTSLAARRLTELVSLSDDPILWQAALEACGGQFDPGVRRFAAAALGHPAPEVRRRACEYFAAQPAGDAVRWLAPALNDDTSYVAAAAARSIGRCGRPDNLESLAALSGHHDAECRLAAAETLAEWGEEHGFAALERLAYDRDPSIRIRAAEAMGRVGADEFTPTLIALLDDDLGVRRVALASLALTAGESVVRDAEGPAPSVAEQVKRWKQWAASRGE